MTTLDLVVIVLLALCFLLMLKVLFGDRGREPDPTLAKMTNRRVWRNRRLNAQARERGGRRRHAEAERARVESEEEDADFGFKNGRWEWD